MSLDGGEGRWEPESGASAKSLRLIFSYFGAGYHAVLASFYSVLHHFLCNIRGRAELYL